MRQDETRQNKTDKARRDKTRRDKIRQNETRQNKTSQNETRRDRIRQNKTRRDKIRQDETRQNIKQKTKPYKINKSLVAYCYRKTSEVVTEYSLDNFAIRPEKFNLNIKQSEVRAKENPKIELNATNADGVISTNYSTSSANLTLIPTNNKTKLAYAFDIVNGEVRNYRLFFTKPADDVAISIKEKIGKEWAIVDADDTVDSCRLITGKSNEVDVIDGSKNWAGVGVDNSYNDPNTNNVNTDIRQNVNKDLHFQKISW